MIELKNKKKFMFLTLIILHSTTLWFESINIWKTMSTIDTKICSRIWKTWKTIKKHSRKIFSWDETSIIDKRKFWKNTILSRKSSNITISKFISIVLLYCTKMYDRTFSSLRSLINSSIIWKKKFNETFFKFVNFNLNWRYIKSLLMQLFSRNKILEFIFIDLNTINSMTIKHLSLQFKNNKYQKKFKSLIFRSQNITIVIKWIFYQSFTRISSYLKIICLIKNFVQTSNENAKKNVIEIRETFEIVKIWAIR